MATPKAPKTKKSSSGADEFFDKVDKDPKLQAELKKNFASIVSVGKKHGFSFTHGEMLEHLRSRWGVKKAPKYDVDTCTG